MSRSCHRCGSALGHDDEDCTACGARNPVPRPWYIPLLSGVILLIMILIFVDIDFVTQVVKNLLGMSGSE